MTGQSETYKAITNDNRAMNNMDAMTVWGEIVATACPRVMKYSGNTTQNKRYEKPTREESKPEVQYQQKKAMDVASMFQGISTRISDTRNADQVYILAGRSRTS